MLLESGRVRFWNHALEEWTGISGEQIEGRPITDFFDKLREPKYVRRLENVFQRGAPLILSSQLHGQVIPCKLPGGEDRIQHVTVTGIPAAHGRFAALFAIQDVTDLTHRVRSYRKMRDEALDAKAELEAQTVRLTEAQHELERFVHVASHDLQEPLRALTAYSEFLEEDAGDALPPQAAPHLRHIRKEAARMQSVILGLLALSNATRTQLFPVAVDMDECLRNALESLSGPIAESQAQVRAEPLPRVLGVQSLIEEVLEHLIENAIKFRRPGLAPEVNIWCEASGDQWTFHVSDNGIGIEPRYSAKVFEPLFRLQSRADFEGSGVGLATCRTIVERHSGQIWNERRAPPGARICFTLPALVEGEDESAEGPYDYPYDRGQSG